MVVNLLNRLETNIAAPHKEIYQPGLFFDRGEMGCIESFTSNFCTNPNVYYLLQYVCLFVMLPQNGTKIIQIHFKNGK